MRDWLEKKSVKAALVVALILVWGYNSYSIVGIANKNETNPKSQKEIRIDLDQLEIPDTDNFNYKDDFRDPFRPRLKKKTQKETDDIPKESQKEQVQIPYLKLTGVVEETALIQNKRKQVFFVSSGDTVGGAHVRYVTEDSVGLVLKEKKFKLKVNN